VSYSLPNVQGRWQKNFQGGEATEKIPKNSKKDRKIAKKDRKIAKKDPKIALLSLFQERERQRKKDQKITKKYRKIVLFSLYLPNLYHVPV